MELTITRKMHMDDQAKYPHDVYFDQFATRPVVQIVRQYITEEAILASKDPHFNDIPLAKWDRLKDQIGMAVGRYLSESNITMYAADFVPQPGMNYYSLSDTVCVAKAAARIIKRRAEKYPGYRLRDTWRTKDGKSRVLFDPDWSEELPFLCYLDGTQTINFSTLNECADYFRSHGRELNTVIKL